MSLKKILDFVSSKTKEGDMTSCQAKKMLAHFGISHSVFTKKQLTSEQRKAKRLRQRIARKNNRGKTKGQSNRKGQLGRFK